MRSKNLRGPVNDECIDFLDKVDALMELLDPHVDSHPFLKSHPELAPLVEIVGSGIARLYMAAGQHSLEGVDDDAK